MTLEQTIRALTEQGLHQSEIARITGTSRGTVHRRQKALGLTLQRPGMRCPELTEAQETEVLALLRSGTGTKRIADRLGIRESSVRGIVKRNHFRHKPGQPGCRYKLSEAKRKTILTEIREHRDFARRIAWKHHVAYKIVLALAHEELRCERFRAGHGQPALSSNFPQKHYDHKLRAS